MAQPARDVTPQVPHGTPTRGLTASCCRWLPAPTPPTVGLLLPCRAVGRGRRQSLAALEVTPSVSEGIPVQEQTVNQFHRPGLFLVDGQIPIRPFVIAEKMPVGNTHLAISEPLPMAPGDVFRNAPAFFLCQATHDGDEEFPFTNHIDTR